MKWSNKYIDIPFVEKGRTRDGLDCWGLVRLVYKDLLDITLPILHAYEDTKDYLNISQLVEENSSQYEWTEVEKGQEQPLDVLIFRVMGHPVHVGLVVGNGYMLHCQRGSNTVHADYVNDRNWGKRLEGIYRHAGSANADFTV